ncbi:EsaB/YukD family protein [Oceanobacillus longus]|uniref:EsaB/YukD family protein n=1 Tax=Oceanobacillus longus TaxID=930120 RepID=A0ABV8GWX0_9BACI
MYIHVTVDMQNYDHAPIELRLSDQHSVKKLVNITWQALNLTVKPREGNWIRVKNKERVYAGLHSLEECGITTGDCVEIL